MAAMKAATTSKALSKVCVCTIMYVCDCDNDIVSRAIKSKFLQNSMSHGHSSSCARAHCSSSTHLHHLHCSTYTRPQAQVHQTRLTLYLRRLEGDFLHCNSKYIRVFDFNRNLIIPPISTSRG